MTASLTAFLRDTFQSEWAQRLGWTLLHSLWQGALVALLLALLLFVLRGRGAQARYLTSCLAMALLALLPVLTFMRLQIEPRQAVQNSAVALPTASVEPPALAPSVEASPPAPEPIAPRLEPFAATPAATSTFKTPAPAPVPWGRRALEAVRPLVPWLAVTWLLGVAAMSVWNLGGWVAVQRLKALTTRPVDESLDATFQRLAARVGVGRSVRLMESTLLVAPLAVGAIRPVILLPVSILTELSAAQLESILLHELAHVRRHDYVVNLLQTAIETLLFYHPAAWWVSRRIRDEREHCCDDLAVAVTRDRATYARALMTVASAAVRAPGLAPAATSGNLLSRVRRLVDVGSALTGSRSRWPAGAAAFALTFALALAVTLTAARSRVQAEQPAAADKGEADKGKTMTVRVTDVSTGQPVEGATVKVTAHDRGKPFPEFKWGGENPTPSRTFTADARGEVKLPLDAFWLRQIRISVTKDGYTLREAEARGEDDGRHLPAAWDAKLEPAGTLGGIVRGENGNPVAGAEIEVSTVYPTQYNESFFDYTRLYGKTTTDAVGRWQIKGAPADVSAAYIRVRHPQFVGKNFSGRTDGAKLQAGAAEFVLSRGLELVGRVTDEKGQPVDGAEVTTDAHNWGNQRTVTTDAEGKFRVGQLERATVLLVRKRGFGPVLREMDPAKGKPEDAAFVLKPARVYAGRVVDSQNESLGNVILSVRSVGPMEVASLMDATTDGEGSFRIEGSDEPLVMEVYKPGYMRLWQHRLDPQDEPFTLRLRKPLRFTGTVTDAGAGAPVKSFRVTTGRGSANQDSIIWDTRESKPGQDGRYSIETDMPTDWHVARIEADGYAPLTSPKVAYGTKADDSPVTFDAKLVRDTGVSGVVVGPSGKPATGAEVVLTAPQNQTSLENGRVGPQQNYSPVTKTDEAGRFSLPASDLRYTLLVLHDDGFAQLSREEFEKAKEVRLKPWARVEGVLRIGTRPGANEQVSLNDGLKTFDRDQPRVFTNNLVRTDAEGRFAFDRVFPGRCTIGRYVQLSADREMSSYGNVVSEPVQAISGQTARVQVGGTGRPLVGRVLIPDRAGLPQGWHLTNGGLSSKIAPPRVPFPAGYASLSREEKAAWYEKWRQSDEGKAVLGAYEKKSAARRYYSVPIGEDGRFRIEDVTPGTYDLTVRAEARSKNAGGQYVIDDAGSGTIEVTVSDIPGGRSDEPQDVGAVAVAPSTKVRPGQAAPGFKVKTVDGKDLDLADYRGKFVLLDFWATWCGPCVEEVPHLKKVYEQFGKNERFAMVSLSLDDRPEEPKQFAEKNGLGWKQGFLGKWAQDKVSKSYGVGGIPSVWLISPEGKVIATGLRGEAIATAVRDALQR